jgi:hypothetical protein
MAQIFVAHRVSFMENGAFKFSGPDLGDVMGQFGSHRIF